MVGRRVHRHDVDPEWAKAYDQALADLIQRGVSPGLARELAATHVMREGLKRQHTWKDVELAALNDPVLSAAVHQSRRGSLTREQALIWACLTLAQIRADMTAREAERLQNEPVTRPVTPSDDTGNQ